MTADRLQPHCLHAVHRFISLFTNMRPITTDVAFDVVCVCVCVCVCLSVC